MEGHHAFAERMYTYMAKMYVRQDKDAKNYIDYKRAIQIIVTDFELLKEDEYHNIYKNTNQKSGRIFTIHYETHVLELPKLKIKHISQATELEKWLLFLSGDGKKKDELAMESSTMKEAYEEIERLSQKPETKRFSEYRERELKDIRQREFDAREDGIEQGIEFAKQDTVLRMYSRDFALEDIALATNISLDYVTEIINSIKQ